MLKGLIITYIKFYMAFIYTFDNIEGSEAVMNRMLKATGNQIVKGREL